MKLNQVSLFLDCTQVTKPRFNKLFVLMNIKLAFQKVHHNIPTEQGNLFHVVQIGQVILYILYGK